MKTSPRLLRYLAATSSLALGSLAASTETAAPYLIHLTSLVDSEQRLLCADGDPESKVRQTLGRPDSVIGNSVWVYQRFDRSEVRYATPNRRCDTTLVSFLPAAGWAERKVGEIARVNSADVAVVAAAMIKDPKYVPNRVAAARPALPAASSPENLPFLVHVTAVVTTENSVLFRDGDSEERVRQAVGEPSEILPGEVWAFRRYERHTVQEIRQVPTARGCEVTLITFSPGAPGTGRTVTAIVMAQPSALSAVAAELKNNPDYLVQRVQAWHDPAM